MFTTDVITLLSSLSFVLYKVLNKEVFLYVLPVTCVEEVRLKRGRATLEFNVQTKRMPSILFLTSYCVTNLIFLCFYGHKYDLLTIFVYWHNGF